MRKALPYIVVLAVAGALGAIAVPNFLDAMARARQKRTMADMRTIGTAWEARRQDLRLQSLATPGDAVVDFSPSTRVSFAELERMLVPKYTTIVPRKDGWNRDFEFALSNPDPEGRATSFAIRSLGRDRRADSDQYTHAVNATFAADLVFQDGNFIRYPDGI